MCRTRETYVVPVQDTGDEAQLNARRLAFGKLVTRALEHASRTQQLDKTAVARLTGISRNTFNRWERGLWKEGPGKREVESFFRMLGLDPEPALRVLEVPSFESSYRRPIPPVFEALLRRWYDARTTDEDRAEIARTLEWLATRPPLREEVARRRDQTGTA